MDPYEFNAIIDRLSKLNNGIEFFEVSSVTKCSES
jgi:tetrahydromethanopterin S-methyltransferase subunit G